MKTEDLQKQIDELQARLDEFKEREAVTPIYPRTYGEGAIYTISGSCIKPTPSDDDMIYHVLSVYGNTFRTQEAAKAKRDREAAKVRCMEAINRVNKGVDGFKVGIDNYFFAYNKDEGLERQRTRYTQCQSDWEHVRTKEAAKELMEDPQFVEDFKLFKGISDESN